MSEQETRFREILREPFIKPVLQAAMQWAIDEIDRLRKELKWAGDENVTIGVVGPRKLRNP